MGQSRGGGDKHPHVIARAPSRPARKRVEARTTEVDCSRVAELLAQHEEIQASELEAIVEVVPTDAMPVARARGRLAHTFRRGEVPAPPAAIADGSQVQPAISMAEPVRQDVVPVAVEPMAQSAPRVDRRWLVFGLIVLAASIAGWVWAVLAR